MISGLRRGAKVRLDLREIARECVELARTRFHLSPDALQYVEHTSHAIVLGDGDAGTTGTTSVAARRTIGS